MAKRSTGSKRRKSNRWGPETITGASVPTRRGTSVDLSSSTTAYMFIEPANLSMDIASEISPDPWSVADVDATWFAYSGTIGDPDTTMSGAGGYTVASGTTNKAYPFPPGANASGAANSPPCGRRQRIRIDNASTGGGDFTVIGHRRIG